LWAAPAAGTRRLAYSERSVTGGFAKRWPVRQEHTVTAADIGPDGTVRAEAFERWVASACGEYLDSCGALRAVAARSGLQPRHRTAGPRRIEALGRPAAIVVTASATEVGPSSFRLMVRLRPLGRDCHGTLDAAYVVRLEDPATGRAGTIGAAVRDELIAIEGSARHIG